MVRMAVVIPLLRMTVFSTGQPQEERSRSSRDSRLQREAMVYSVAVAAEAAGLHYPAMTFPSWKRAFCVASGKAFPFGAKSPLD
uniref:Putative secreted peptide n=1 Tax=Anopheles braziliensis TaxID=58242 RepID=A0A2M3ZWQ2_9DIPT